MASRVVAAIEDWGKGRCWAPRALVVAALAWLGVTLTFDPAASTIFDAINLGIHEAGHLLFRSGGDVLHMLGGTLLQCLAPVIAGVIFARRCDWFGSAFCGFWLAVNLFGVATYMADARAQLLQLVTVGGGDARHDWAFLFGELGCLRSDTTIAGAVRVLAFLVSWGSIAAGGGIVYLIWHARRAGPVVDPAVPVPPSAARPGQASAPARPVMKVVSGRLPRGDRLVRK